MSELSAARARHPAGKALPRVNLLNSPGLATVLQFPLASTGPWTCTECLHFIYGPRVAWCARYGEQVMDESAGLECPEFEEDE